MSVSLDEVLIAAGYDIRNNVDDAQWLLGQRDEFDELCEKANDVVDEYEYAEISKFADEEDY